MPKKGKFGEKNSYGIFLMDEINQLFQNNDLQQIYPSLSYASYSPLSVDYYNTRVKADFSIERLANILTELGIKDKDTVMSDEQKEKVLKCLSSSEFDRRFQTTNPVEEKIAELNAFLKGNDLPELNINEGYMRFTDTALNDSVFLEYLGEFESKCLMENLPVFYQAENIHLAEEQKQEITKIFSSVFAPYLPQPKEPVKREKKPELPYPNNLLYAIGIQTENPLSKAFEKELWEIIQKTNISDRNKDVLMQYYRDGRTQTELAEVFSVAKQRISEIVNIFPRRINKYKGTEIEKLYQKECMGELEYQNPDYPNNLLEEIGLGKINGKMSEAFQSMLEDVICSADTTKEKCTSEMLKDFYKHDFSKAEIAEKNGLSESMVSTYMSRMKQTIPAKEASELLLDELKSNDNIAMSEDSSLIVLLHMEKADPVLATIHDALAVNKLITFGDVLQAGMEQVQKTFSEAGFTAGEFSKFTEIMTDFCNQNPEEWKYRTPERTEQLDK